MSTVSATTLKTDATSKVLPGDKTGLPLEIWQIIFSYLSVRDLCHVACVSKTWHDLSLSVDMTRWKELYLGCTEWKHPFWPLSLHMEPASWKQSYRQQYLSTRFWLQGLQQFQAAGCINILKRKRERQTIEVGPGLEHQTLKSALAAASAYDRILVHPGIYDEQLETSVRYPIELVGAGELGSVILVVCIEQLSASGRLTNVVLRAPWFTAFVLKVRTGYMQVDNCIIEDGKMYVQNPGTCHTQFCTFRHTTVILQHLNASIIRNCEFSQSDNANIVVEGYMKEERIWAYQQLRQEADSVFCHQSRSLSCRHHLKPTESTTSTTHSTITGKSYVASIIKTFDAFSQDQGDDPEGVDDMKREGTQREGMSRPVQQQRCPGEPMHHSEHRHLPKTHQNCVANKSRRPSNGCKSESEWEDDKWLEINDERNLFHFQSSACKRRQSMVSSCSDSVTNCENVQSHPSVGDGVSDDDLCQIMTDKCRPLADGHKQSHAQQEKYGDRSAVCTLNQEASQPGDDSCHSLAENGAHGSCNCVTKHPCSSFHPGKQDVASSANSFPCLVNDGNLSAQASLDCQASCREQSEQHTCNHADEDNHPLINPSSLCESSPFAHMESAYCQDNEDQCGMNKGVEPCDLQHQSNNQQRGLELPAVEKAASDEHAAECNSRRSYSSGSHRNGSSSSSGGDDLSILDELESGRSSSSGESMNSNRSTSTTSTSTDEESNVEGLFHPEQEWDLSDGEESVIMLPHLRHKHLETSLSANAVNAEMGSICSQTTGCITLSASQDEGVLTHVSRVQGCLIHQCRMIHSEGGVMVGPQAHAIISECDISNVGYGIRCIQNAQIVISKNNIHHCRTSGIFMRLGSTGLIAGNDIHSNNEAGIDIRKSADPIVQHNKIHHGKRSGVVVLGSGRGQIRNNDIYCNKEAGIYILYGGNPTISENHIYDGFAAGIAVNEGGRGLIYENTVEGNHWGGVDVRLGSKPTICRNTIVDGLGDGVVIGERGQGIFENNVVSGNAGCGMWIMSASRPYIHGNQINDNGDTGIMMVNKTDVHREASSLLPASGFSTCQAASHSYSVLAMSAEDVSAVPAKCTHTTLQYNNIYHNKGRGVGVELGDEVDIQYNAIHANHDDGVWINQEAPVTMSSNSISSNLGCGIASGPGAWMLIKGNGIYDNHKSGLLCKGKADILDNDLVGNYAGGIILESKAVCKVCRNRIHSYHGGAVKVAAAARESVITDNLIYSGGSDHIIDLSECAIVQDNNVACLPQNAENIACGSHQTMKEVTFNKCHFLKDPPARPVTVAPPPSLILPAHNVSAVTKVMLPSGDDCHQGSKLCIVL